MLHVGSVMKSVALHRVGLLVVLGLTASACGITPYGGPDSVIAAGSDRGFIDRSALVNGEAAIAYDPASHRFHIGHGGKSNLVRLNGKPLLSTEPLVDGDEIQIGETTLVLKVLCTPEFNWSSIEAEGDGHDMAIA